MSKKRLYEIAKEVGVESKVIVAKAQELGLSVKTVSYTHLRAHET